MDDVRGGDVLAAGTRLEEFEVERELGAGGFGVTYLARDLSLERQVAIKEYLPHDWGARGPDGAVVPRSATHAQDYRWGLERFLEEARVLARLRHGCVVQVHRVFEARGTAYMVTEYVEGRNLAEALAAEGPWPQDRVLALLDALTSGLVRVHAAGLAHRDVKPSNVMLRGDGSPVLIDFGAARQAVGRQSRSLTAVLTPGYAPLEQYSTKGRQGPWTDVYALGAVAYEALSGRAPEEATERADDDTLRPVTEVAAHGVSAGLAAAIGSALALRGPDRPQSVGEWREMLGLPAAGGTAGTAGAGPARRPAASRRPVPPPTEAAAERPPAAPDFVPQPGSGPAGSSRRWWLAGAAALVLVALAGAGLAWRAGSAAPADPPDVFRDCGTCPEMVVVPAGAFQMGSRRDDDEARNSERPRHRVSVEPFALGRYEVTREEYGAFVSATGHDVSGGCYEWGYDAEERNIVWPLDGTASWRNPGFAQGGDHPVVCVNWRDARAFVEWLSRETGERYRLPSEAEWEYAARAGTATRRHWGDEAGAQQCEYANGADATYEQMLRRFRDINWNGPVECTDGSVGTAPVGSFSPNDFGLHDVLGNVWEWVEDCWHETYARAPADGSAWTSGGECGRRVLRGGSWPDYPRYLRSANRYRNFTGIRPNNAGFRVSRTLD